MKKDTVRLIVAALSGLLIGSTLQYLIDDPVIRRQKKSYDELADRYNEKTQKLIETIADVETAKVLNAQVATYACSLRKALDQYEDF
jgi:hypothetical protein